MKQLYTLDIRLKEIVCYGMKCEICNSIIFTIFDTIV